jgi:hypothetical protein
MDQRPKAVYDTIAAELTAAMLRFDIERLPRNYLALPYDNPGRLGEVAYLFLPRQDLVLDVDLVHHLEALPKPVILGALAQKGMIATWWPSAMDERALHVWEHTLANQKQSAESMVSGLGLAKEDPILLETTAQTLLIATDAFRHWTETYGVHIAWTLGDSNGDPRARVRLHLIRGDGGRTPGQSCSRPE